MNDQMHKIRGKGGLDFPKDGQLVFLPASRSRSTVSWSCCGGGDQVADLQFKQWEAAKAVWK